MQRGKCSKNSNSGDKKETRPGPTNKQDKTRTK